MPPSLPFLVLFALLLVYPNRVRLPERIARASAVWKPPVTFSVSLAAVVLTVLVLAPQFTGLHLMDWASALAATILLLSLSLLVRTSGQISMCQVSFAAIGAAAFSHLTVGIGVPWLLALLTIVGNAPLTITACKWLIRVAGEVGVGRPASSPADSFRSLQVSTRPPVEILDRVLKTCTLACIIVVEEVTDAKRRQDWRGTWLLG